MKNSMVDEALGLMTVKPRVLPMHPAEFLSFCHWVTNSDSDYARGIWDDAVGSIVIDNEPSANELARIMDWIAINHWGLE